MPTIETFEDLDVYKAACELRRAIAGVCRQFPAEEKYLLKDQLIRSSRSVSANIAEGFGRHHHQENLQFCRQARGSLTESLDHLNCAHEAGLLTDAVYTQLRAQLQSAWQLLNGYIRYLQRCAKDGVARVAG